jgi:hypothetical protein
MVSTPYGRYGCVLEALEIRRVVPPVPSITLKRVSSQQDALYAPSPYPLILEALKLILAHPREGRRRKQERA